MSTSVFHEEEYNKRFDLSVWRKAVTYLGPYRWYLAALIPVLIVLGGIDATFPFLTMRAIDTYVVPGNLTGLSSFAWLYVGLTVLLSIHVYLLIALAGKIYTHVSYDIRKTGFERLQELSFSYFDQKPVGWLMARMTSDSDRLSEILAWGLVDLTWGLAMMTSMAVIMLYVNWRLALLVLSVVPALVAISGTFQKRILKSYRDVRQTNSHITGAFNEGIMGAQTTKTLVREDANLSEFKELTTKMFSTSVQAAVLSALYRPVVLLLGTMGAGFAIWFGGSGVILGTLTYGTLVAFISYALSFFDPVQDMARVFAELQNAQASAERIFEMIATEPEIRDTPEVLVQKHPPMIGAVEFVNVGFKYTNGETVLENFNLTVNAGETIALVGETGAGKSTIVNLACRFYEPTLGNILIDGVDYRQRSLHWLHSNLGIVLQTPHLFSGTISENIRYGRLEATDAEIEQAARLVQAHEFITKLEKSYATEVGEGGGLLSTGQKQLISFARAILTNPRLFVLDEATSSVDTETEQLIQQAIEKTLAGRTSFIIAHRLSTIRSADRILVIRDGKITEQGNHVELLRQGGYYYRLYTNQFMRS